MTMHIHNNFILTVPLFRLLMFVSFKFSSAFQMVWLIWPIAANKASVSLLQISSFCHHTIIEKNE